MKRVLLSLVFLAMSAAVCAAQPKSFGLRIGDGLELVYQQDLYPGFLEADVGVSGHGQFPGLRLGVSYAFPLVTTRFGGGNFTLFLGPGASAGLYGKMQFISSVYAQFGMEYAFDSVPLELAADTRPGLTFGPSAIVMDMASLIPALSVRWRF